MSVQKKKKRIPWLIVALLIVVAGGVLFVGMVGGWFGESKTTIDAEYYSDNPGLMDLGVSDYEQLISEKKSFLIFVDHVGCTTADRLREYITKYADEKKINVYKMMFRDVKESSLHDYVKYYPSIVVVDKGRVRAYLRADSDEDVEEYNDFGAFSQWLDGLV